MSDLEAARQRLILQLTEVRCLFDAKEKGWQLALIGVLKHYGRSIGLDRVLLDPLQQLMFETVQEQGVRKSINKAAIDTLAAAAVTVLRERGEPRKVDEGVRKVSRLAGLNAKELSRFRNNLSSGRKSGNLRAEIIQNYDLALDFLRKMPTPEVLDLASHLKTFVR